MSAPERITYLARRHPSFATHDEWMPRWREHWALAARQPESATVARYAQCEVVVDTTSPPHDAVAFSEYVSPEARRSNRASEGYHAIMRADELVVFDRAILECSFFGAHHVLAGVEEGPFKVVRFLVGSTDDADWADRATAVLGEAALLGYAQTRALPPPPAGWGLAVDGCEELWVDTLDDARRLLVPPEGSLRMSVGVVTREVVLKRP